jgi:SulP family sulfate permease
MAALAALLLNVAWNMAEARHVVRTVRTGPRSDTLVLLSCFGLTVVFDMTVAVTTGIVLAAFLFMRRMIELSGARLLDEPGLRHIGPVPAGLAVFEIAGPLFFGAAHKATATLHRVGTDVRVVLLDLSAVPVLDATGLVNLGSAIDRLQRNGQEVILAGLQRGPRILIRRARIASDRVQLAADLDAGIRLARRRLGLEAEVESG